MRNVFPLDARDAACVSKNMGIIQPIYGLENVSIVGEELVVEGSPEACNKAMRIASSLVAGRINAKLNIHAEVYVDSIFTVRLLDIPIVTQIFHLEKKKSRILFRSVYESLKWNIENSFGSVIHFIWQNIKVLRVQETEEVDYATSLTLHLQINLDARYSHIRSEIVLRNPVGVLNKSALKISPEISTFLSSGQRPAPLDLVTFVICCRRNGDVEELLMVLERSNKWFLPAGHVDFGESFSEAGVRETKEETGLDVCIDSFVDIFYEIDPYYSAYHCVVAAKVIGGSLKTTADAESLGAAWFPLSEIVQQIGTGIPNKASRPYRKPEEIGPIIHRFANLQVKQCNFSFPQIHNNKAPPPNTIE